MKKRYAFLPVMALLLSPSIFRANFSPLYDKLMQYHPVGGPMLTVVLDIIWLWVVLFGIMLGARVVRLVKRLLVHVDNASVPINQPVR